MQDLQARPQARRLQVEFAQAAAAAQLVADEQILALEAAADGLQLGIHLQGLEFRQLGPAEANAIGQRIHQRVDAEGG